MRIKIKVTKEVLEKSKYCCRATKIAKSGHGQAGTTCAIAVATRGILGNVVVGSARILFPVSDSPQFGDVSRVIAELPYEARVFIEVFDNSSVLGREKMKPFEFEVELTKLYINSININEVKELINESSTLELVEV